MKIYHIFALFASFGCSSCVVDKMEKLAPRPTPAMSATSGVSLTKLENGRTEIG